MRWSEKTLLPLSGGLVMLLVIDQLRLFGRPITSFFLNVETQYFYALVALLLPLVFLTKPSRYRLADQTLAVSSFVACLWLLAHGELILEEGWEFIAPDHAIVASLILWLAVLEGVRRVAGVGLLAITGLISFYPLVADWMPTLISGMSIGLRETAAYHAMSSESLIGLPFQAFAQIVIGFLVFGATLQSSGGGRFFINLAFATLGRVRGGSAKVAIFASGLMGSMSGSVVTNVMTTGQLTIPTMRGQGYAPKTAAAVEACASTGGVLLPPIMGSTAFIMATFLELPYVQVAFAALIPALLYFFALFLQLDAHAARHGLVGLPESDVPRLRDVLKAGWPFLLSFGLLVFFLLVLQRETLAPWLASAVLLLINQVLPEHRLDRAGWLNWSRSIGQLLMELLTILCAVGLIVGALSVTGLSGTLVNDLLFVAGSDVLILLLMGALTSFVLGIGLTVTAAYVFLAIVLAPALIGGGLMPLAVHLFILYWGMLSFITPPVALGAFSAASIAQSSPIATGFEAMRLGVAIYLVPFLFVLNPSLIGSGALDVMVKEVLRTGFAIALVAYASQRVLPIMGVISWPSAVAVFSVGLLIMMPDLMVGRLGLEPSQIWAIAGSLIAGVLAVEWAMRQAVSRAR
jgi:TRAP transporter 4TM/12TM fusion protein